MSIQYTITEVWGTVVHIFHLSDFQAAKKFVNGKKSMAATGDLGSTPFVDEL